MARRSYYRTERSPEGDLRYPMPQNTQRGLRGRSYHTPKDVAYIESRIASDRAQLAALGKFLAEKASRGQYWHNDSEVSAAEKKQKQLEGELSSWTHELEHARTVVGHKRILKQNKLARALAAKPIRIR